MIAHNDFREFQKVAEEVDSQLFFANLYVYRDRKEATPRNVSGRIYINDTEDEGYFGGELVHKAGHSVFDPVTAFNYVTCVAKIKEELNVDDDRAMKLANVASDLIGAFEVARNKKLNTYRKWAIEYMFKDKAKVDDPVARELLGISRKLHGCKFKFKVVSRYFSQVKGIVESNQPRWVKYVEIAKIFNGLFDLRGQGGEAEGAEGFGETPITVDGKEAEETAKQILSSSKDVQEARSLMTVLAKITEGKGLGQGSEERSGLESGHVDLQSFYEAKARNVMMYVSYPQEQAYKGVKLGSLRWKPQLGVKAIDVKRTMLKYGVNVPLVTTQSARMVEKFISSSESRKPCDLVVSIDVSGSTGRPLGTMDSVSDYEVVMFYALVNIAKLIDQKVGLTLWSTNIDYTSLPHVYDWRESEKLKRVILEKWTQGWTNIFFALKQTKNNPDKLFFIFTDGEVNYGQLIDVENAVFFLIKPEDKDYSKFVERYGKERVIRIDSIHKIPKVTLEHYVKLFRGS